MEGQTFRSLRRRGMVELIVQKSRFIGWASPASTEQEALRLIDEAKAEYPDATHHCYAYVVHDEAPVIRFHDDGEPSGTAGRPILEVLTREGLQNAAVVVTRYFGGTLLGAGGLTRAYGRSAKQAADAAGIVTYELHQRLRLQLPYTAYGAVEHLLRSEGIVTHEPEFATDVALTFDVPHDLADNLRTRLDELVGGTGRWECLTAQYLPRRAGQA